MAEEEQPLGEPQPLQLQHYQREKLGCRLKCGCLLQLVRGDGEQVEHVPVA